MLIILQIFTAQTEENVNAPRLLIYSQKIQWSDQMFLLKHYFFLNVSPKIAQEK